jgi:hypothetical protein
LIGNESRDQRIVFRQVRDDFRSDAERGGGQRQGVFAFAVNAQQIAVLAADSQHKAFTRHVDPIIAIRLAARQRRR